MQYKVRNHIVVSIHWIRYYVSHSFFEFSSFLEADFPSFLDSVVSSLADVEVLLFLEASFGFVESSLVSAAWSGSSVSLCHIDFRNPSFLFNSPDCELSNLRMVKIGRMK